MDRRSKHLSAEERGVIFAEHERGSSQRGIGRWTVQIVKRSDTADGFEVLPRRWVVERTFAGLRPVFVKALGEIHRQRRSMGAHRPQSTRYPLYRKGMKMVS